METSDILVSVDENGNSICCGKEVKSSGKYTTTRIGDM